MAEKPTLVDFNGRDLDYARQFQIEIRDICHPASI